MIASRSLEGKVAVVTAGSTGFGRAVAVAYARAGARVVVGDITETPGPGNFDETSSLNTVPFIESFGGDARYVQCDVTKQEDVIGLVEQAVSSFGRIDVFVNNAGVYRGGRPVHELSVDDLDACWQVLVKGTWFGCQQAIKQFLVQGDGGAIVNIVSTAGLRAHPYQAPYNMAKAAQANLTRCVALEYAHAAIRANGICPTYVKTSMSRGGFENEDNSAMVTSVIPMHRWGEISDVVNAALFFAADESSFLTGVMLPVDGGEMLSGRAPA